MRTTAPLVVLSAAALLLACNGSTNSPPKATLCPAGETAGPGGTCLVADAGTPATCTAADKPIGTSTAPAAQQQHLGTFTVGQSVAFDVPANTASVTIVEQAVSAPDSIVFKPSAAASAFSLDNTAVPLVVKDPSGNTVYDDSVFPSDPTAASVFFASDSPATGTLTFPNTTSGLTRWASGLPSGTVAGGNPWTFTVSDFAYECTAALHPGESCPSGGTATSNYDITVITKPTSGSGGNLDVNFYFVATTASSQPLTAADANAGNDQDLNRLVQTLKTIMNAAGITVRTVTFKDLPSAVQQRYATGVDADQSGACGPLSQLLKNADRGNTMNIFLVSKFTSASLQPGQLIVGIDGTIPGPSTIGQTVASGAAVSVADLRASSTLCTGAPHFPDANQQACGADVKIGRASCRERV